MERAPSTTTCLLRLVVIAAAVIAASRAARAQPAHDLYELTRDGTVFLDAEKALRRIFGEGLDRRQGTALDELGRSDGACLYRRGYTSGTMESVQADLGIGVQGQLDPFTFGAGPSLDDFGLPVTQAVSTVNDHEGLIEGQPSVYQLDQLRHLDRLGDEIPFLKPPFASPELISV
jgi:hypothetical protein